MTAAVSVAEIIRLVAGLPFDVASKAWFLIWIDQGIRENRIQRSPQIMAIYRLVAAGPAVIKLASVDQRSMCIK